MKGPKKEQSVINFGKRLRAIRENANVSQEQIHYALGITQMHVSRIETGYINTSIGNAAKLAAFFGLEDYQLFQYNEIIPNSDVLQKNISRYLIKNNVDPKVFLKKGLTNLIKKEIIASKILNVPRFAIEIRKYLEDKYDVQFSTSRISDVMDDFRKKGLIEKLPTGKRSKFQYQKTSNGS